MSSIGTLVIPGTGTYAIASGLLAAGAQQLPGLQSIGYVNYASQSVFVRTGTAPGFEIAGIGHSIASSGATAKVYVWVVASQPSGWMYNGQLYKPPDVHHFPIDGPVPVERFFGRHPLLRKLGPA